MAEQLMLPGMEALFSGMVTTIRQQVLGEMRAKESQEPAAPRLLTAAQAAAYLGRTESAIRQLIHKKQIPIVRFGRNVRIDVRDLETLINEYKQ